MSDAEFFQHTNEASAIVDDELAQRFRATLHPYVADQVATEAPLGLHWCLFLPVDPLSSLKPDGHSADHPLLPRFPGTRRMWAGGEIEFLAPLPLSTAVQRVSRLLELEDKQGGSGRFHLAKIEHVLTCSGVPVIRERQDLVFLPARPAASVAPQGANQPRPAPAARTIAGADRVWVGHASEVLLFRYSAITFNAHRIHYDRPYATEVEGYSGVVVHGPLQASVLMNLAQEQARRIPRRFTYRGIAPLIAGQAFAACAASIQGDAIDLWMQDAAGTVTMRARAVFQ